MDWDQVTESLLELLPQPEDTVREDIEVVTRYTWELASRIKDCLVDHRGKRPSAVYATHTGSIVFEFARSETVLVNVVVRSTEIVIHVFSQGAQKMKTMFEAPFEMLERFMKEIALWLNNLLKSSTIVTTQPLGNFGGA